MSLRSSTTFRKDFNSILEHKHQLRFKCVRVNFLWFSASISAFAPWSNGKVYPQTERQRYSRLKLTCRRRRQIRVGTLCALGAHRLLPWWWWTYCHTSHRNWPLDSSWSCCSPPSRTPGTSRWSRHRSRTFLLLWLWWGLICIQNWLPAPSRGR